MTVGPALEKLAQLRDPYADSPPLPDASQPAPLPPPEVQPSSLDDYAPYSDYVALPSVRGSCSAT